MSKVVASLPFIHCNQLILHVREVVICFNLKRSRLGCWLDGPPLVNRQSHKSFKHVYFAISYYNCIARLYCIYLCYIHRSKQSQESDPYRYAQWAWCTQFDLQPRPLKLLWCFHLGVVCPQQSGSSLLLLASCAQTLPVWAGQWWQLHSLKDTHGMCIKRYTQAYLVLGVQTP